MNQYVKMADMFLSDRNKKKYGWVKTGWTHALIAKTIASLDQIGQVLSYKDKFGKIKGFVAWVYCGDEYNPADRQFRFLNQGNNVFPLFVSTSVFGRGMIRKIYKKMIGVANQKGGKLISFRHDRIKKFGGGR